MKKEQLENKCAIFNRAFIVGDQVEVYKTIGGETFVDEIKHEATIMGDHTPVCWLKQKGSYSIDFVKGIYKETPRQFDEEILLRLLKVQSNLNPRDFDNLFGHQGKHLFHLYAQRDWNLLDFFFNKINGENREKLLEFINNYNHG